MEVFIYTRSKAILFFSFLLFFLPVTEAATIPKELAAEHARNYWKQQIGNALRSSDLSSEPTYTAYSTLPGFEERACFYLFSDSLNGGFVIVSGDDRAHPILGYSPEGTFETTEMPPALQWWLARYREQIESLITGDDNEQEEYLLSYATDYQLRTEKKNNKTIATAGWHQRSPFNLYCPLVDGEATAAGCVATCMAIVMRHHQWPERGTGQHSYSWERKRLTANFDHPYAWDQMVMQYDNKATDQQREAVATLVAHCGIALESNYGVASTSAYMGGVQRALFRFFGYDIGLERKAKQYIEKEEWMRLIHEEIDADRPIIYSGTTRSGIGHMFVCDGYAEEDMIHINWGWGKQFNAFYRVDALNAPNEMSYSENIEMMIGIQRDKGEATGDYSDLRLVGNYGGTGLTIEGENNRVGQPFTAAISSLVNLKASDFSGNIGVALVDKEMRIKEIIGKNDIIYLRYNQYVRSISVSCVVTQPVDSEDLFCVVALDEKQNDWKMLWADRGIIDRLNAGEHMHPLDISSTEGLENMECLIRWNDNSLDITTPQSEQIDIYTLQGERLFTTRKAAGNITLPAFAPHARTLIIHGNSGWSRIISRK